MNVIAIFDVGKTNKKLFLFDEQYQVVAEQSESFAAVKDEDGDDSEDLERMTEWVRESLARVMARRDVRVRAVNFSAYGASLVHIGMDGKPVAPLYNYLKAYPEALKRRFYETYGGEVTLSMLTASPVLGSLNSGMQLYRIKYEQPELFDRIRYSLHLPQYLSYLLTGTAVSDITSIGCHTNLWNFPKRHYHEWVYREGVVEKLAPIVPSWTAMKADGVMVGVGLHDSSAALIPYLQSFQESWVLISTGTWCISMNPFNDSPLRAGELQQDCLCYMSYEGLAMKASRLFAGYEHEREVRRLAEYFQCTPAAAAGVRFDAECVAALRARVAGAAVRDVVPGKASVFGERDLKEFGSFEEAYHCLMMYIMDQQVRSTSLVLHDTDVRRIFVDGGFGKNEVYMHLLADAFPELKVFAASIPQATAMGAALAIHEDWNKGLMPAEMIELKAYSPA
jgi:sugar (pentulose or hexulose) kinase